MPNPNPATQTSSPQAQTTKNASAGGLATDTKKQEEVRVLRESIDKTNKQILLVNEVLKIVRKDQEEQEREEEARAVEQAVGSL